MNNEFSKHADISQRMSSKPIEAITYAQVYTYAALAYSVMAATWALAEVAYAIQEGGRSNRKR